MYFTAKHVGCGSVLDCATALATCKMASASACALRMMALASPSGTQYLSLFHSLGLVDPGCFLSLGTQNQRLLLSPRRSESRHGGYARPASASPWPPAHFRESDVLQLHAVHFDTPLVGGLVKDHLEFGVDGITRSKCLIKFELADHVSKRCLGEFLDDCVRQIVYLIDGLLRIGDLKIEEALIPVLTLSRVITCCEGKS